MTLFAHDVSDIQLVVNLAETFLLLVCIIKVVSYPLFSKNK